MRKLLVVTLMLVFHALTVAAAAIGSWNSYLAYSSITDIQPAGKLVYVLSSKGLFSYNTADNSIQTYDKMNALSDCNISHIAYCKAAKRLVIVYENQNIDLLDNNGDVVNISDYYNKSMTEDKTVNEVKVIGTSAYLSTHFGILKINVADGEITATYPLGQNVLSSTVLGNYIYATTPNGILKGNMGNNLLDKGNWSTEANFLAQHIFSIDNQLMAAADGSIYRKVNGNWEHAYNQAFKYCSMTNGQLIFCDQHTAMIFTTATDPVVITDPDAQFLAIAYDDSNNCYWANQPDQKLQSMTIVEKQFAVKNADLCPDGPKYNYFGFMRYYNNMLYTCGGGFDSFAELFREGTVQTLADNTWEVYEDNLGEKTNRLYQDLTCMDVDPKNPKHVFVGGRAGLYEYKDGKFVKHYHPENSPLMYALDDNSPNYILTLGLKYDKQGNLWCLNSLAKDASILELKTDGTWESHHTKTLMDDNGRSLPNMKCMTLDSRGLFWFVNNHWSVPSFYCFDPSTQAMNHYTTFINEDGATLTITGARCIAEDKEGNMWVGTNIGPLLLPKEDISKGSNPVLQQVKVPRNDGTNFADYLLSGVDVTCIAVDGGNRKWFGTNGNGIYLISSDNMTQVQHFLSTNSKLLSDNIESIAINDQTGEVFISTDNGLCSYMSDATATNETMTKDNVYAYPNPVRPDYTGLITVVGLSMNADVKIVTANGALVAQGTSNGGTFTWDGRDLNGDRVASGVYMVMTATSDGKKGTVCKIAIVN